MTTPTNQIRAWCIDYSLRTPREKNPTANEVVEDAKIFEQYVSGNQSASVLKLAKKDKP
jgi:hypothetical protein